MLLGASISFSSIFSVRTPSASLGTVGENIVKEWKRLKKNVKKEMDLVFYHHFFTLNGENKGNDKWECKDGDEM